MMNRGRERGFIINPFSGGGGGLGGALTSIPIANCLMYLKMNGAGASFVDSGPNALTITPQGGATQVAGLYGNALSLGANLTDYLDIAATAALRPVHDFTLNFKFMFPSGYSGSSDGFIDFGGYIAGLSVRYDQSSSGELDYYYFGSGPRTTGGHTLSNGVWHEAQISRIGNTGYMFWDGGLEDTTTVSGDFAATVAARIGTVLSGGVINPNARLIDDLIWLDIGLNSTSYTPRSGEYTLVAETGPAVKSVAYNGIGTVANGDTVLLFFISTGGYPSLPTGWTRNVNATDANGYSLAVYSSIFSGGNAAANLTNFPVGLGQFQTIVFTGTKSVLQVGSFATPANGVASMSIPSLGSATASTSKLVVCTGSRDPACWFQYPDFLKIRVDNTNTYFRSQISTQDGVQSGVRNVTKLGTLTYDMWGVQVEVG
jgi:hypothetical protein